MAPFSITHPQALTTEAGTCFLLDPRVYRCKFMTAFATIRSCCLGARRVSSEDIVTHRQQPQVQRIHTPWMAAQMIYRLALGYVLFVVQLVRHSMGADTAFVSALIEGAVSARVPRGLPWPASRVRTTFHLFPEAAVQKSWWLSRGPHGRHSFIQSQHDSALYGTS